jgi:hypothetical protein
MAVFIVKRFRGIDRANMIEAERGLSRLIQHNNRNIAKGLPAIFTVTESEAIGTWIVQLQAWLAQRISVIR